MREIVNTAQNLIAVINNTLQSPSVHISGTPGQQVSPQLPPQQPGQQELQRFVENITVFNQCIILYLFIYLFFAIQGKGSACTPTGLMSTLSPARNDEVLLYPVLQWMKYFTFCVV